MKGFLLFFFLAALVLALAGGMFVLVLVRGPTAPPVLRSWARRVVNVLRLCSWTELGFGAFVLLYALAAEPTLDLLRAGGVFVALGWFGLNRTTAWKQQLQSVA